MGAVVIEAREGLSVNWGEKISDVWGSS